MRIRLDIELVYPDEFLEGETDKELIRAKLTAVGRQIARGIEQVTWPRVTATVLPTDLSRFPDVDVPSMPAGAEPDWW